jgi:hypothetical protein
MPSSGRGPRDYTQGTERALYTFSATTCYFPDCPARVIVLVDGEPVSNVEIAHIRGAVPGAPRYDPAMTDDERRSFANLILLCTPHHKIVDRLHPGDYPVEVLADWKAQHERDAGIDGSVLAQLTEDRLLDLIEKAVATAGPQRLLTVELGLGVSAPGKTVILPADTAKDYFGMYTDLGPAVLVLTVRSQGALKAYVNSYAIRFEPAGFTLHETHDFPRINHLLPCPVDPGESKSWMYSLEFVTTMVSFLQKQEQSITEVVAQVDLASGETLKSAGLAIEYLGKTP